ncbi:hypothetical protein DFJ74DRAFT_747206, partial [Hyaloraphidium curvatum]
LRSDPPIAAATSRCEAAAAEELLRPLFFRARDGRDLARFPPRAGSRTSGTCAIASLASNHRGQQTIGDRQAPDSSDAGICGAHGRRAGVPAGARVVAAGVAGRGRRGRVVGGGPGGQLRHPGRVAAGIDAVRWQRRAGQPAVPRCGGRERAAPCAGGRGGGQPDPAAHRGAAPRRGRRPARRADRGRRKLGLGGEPRAVPRLPSTVVRARHARRTHLHIRRQETAGAGLRPRVHGIPGTEPTRAAAQRRGQALPGPLRGAAAGQRGRRPRGLPGAALAVRDRDARRCAEEHAPAARPRRAVQRGAPRAHISTDARDGGRVAVPRAGGPPAGTAGVDGPRGGRAFGRVEGGQQLFRRTVDGACAGRPVRRPRARRGVPQVPHPPLRRRACRLLPPRPARPLLRLPCRARPRLPPLLRHRHHPLPPPRDSVDALRAVVLPFPPRGQRAPRAGQRRRLGLFRGRLRRAAPGDRHRPRRGRLPAPPPAWGGAPRQPAPRIRRGAVLHARRRPGRRVLPRGLVPLRRPAPRAAHPRRRKGAARHRAGDAVGAPRVLGARGDRGQGGARRRGGDGASRPARDGGGGGREEAGVEGAGKAGGGGGRVFGGFGEAGGAICAGVGEGDEGGP